MIRYGPTYKRMVLALLLVIWAMAFVMAQGSIVVSEGETKTYQVEFHSGSSYLWKIYNEPTFQNIATESELTIVSGGNTSSIVITWLKPGTYYPTVVETAASGCDNTKASVVTVQEGTVPWPVAKISNETIEIGGKDFILIGNCQTVALDASSSTGVGLSFKWEPYDYLDNPNISTPIFTPGKSTNYRLTVTDSYDRSSSLEVGIKVAMPVSANAGEHLYTSENQLVMLDGSKSSGEDLIYHWQTENGNIVEGAATARPIVDRPGEYFLTVSDTYGCSDLDSVEVNLYTQAVPDNATTELNFAVEINVLANDIPISNLNPPSLRIVNNPKNGIAVVQSDSIVVYTPNQYFVGNDGFTYSICDYYEKCDESEVLVIVNDLPLFIPKAFSPNGDGINDFFEIKGIAKYTAVSIQIFNRWGNVVFESSNYGAGNGRSGYWDGIGQSRGGNATGPVATGTYYYVLKASGGENISGSIYLDR